MNQRLEIATRHGLVVGPTPGKLHQRSLFGGCWRRVDAYDFGRVTLRRMGLKAAIAAGCAHVADRRGGAPPQPERWGWRHAVRGWQPAGACIGWLDGDDLYLEPDLSYRVAQAQAGAERIPVTERTLRARLGEDQDPGS